ncbi:hypothetical protein BJ965_006148 [Streptomyces luteogriseus]|uniref:Uncharacterized protein n=1 Tax=Streptomyces luteogriseus TaxID=68233 RepID=A0A7W7GJJ0_9ACTN|nr:hypothetical protein [Streptomyces luteogriseus]
MPKRPRRSVAGALTGFHSATVRSRPGSPLAFDPELR